jgi:predicted glycosyltransferase
MGGYNTVCEVLTLGKRAIVVPRVRPVQEQWIRAQRMAKRGLLRALHPDSLTPQALGTLVRDELAAADRSRARPALNMDGLRNVAASVHGHLSAARRPAQFISHRKSAISWQPRQALSAS